MADVAYAVLVIVLAAATGISAGIAGLQVVRARRARSERDRMRAAAEGRLAAYRQALEQVAALARSRGATIADVRQAVAPHLQVRDTDDDATLVLRPVGRPARRRPSPRPRPHPTSNGHTNYTPGRATPRPRREGE